MDANHKTASLRYVITGLGRSGTTFLAHTFLKAGFDMGNVKTRGIGVNAPVGGGLEHKEFAHINMRLQRSLMYGEQIGDTNESCSPERAAEIFQPLFRQNWPQVLKDPRYLDTFMIWHHAGYMPEHIFLCVRESEQRDKSLAHLYEEADEDHRKFIELTRDTYYSYFSVFNMLVYCQQYDIPYTTVLYPRIGMDKEYANKILGTHIPDAWSIVKETWDASLLHHSAHSQKEMSSI